MGGCATKPKVVKGEKGKAEAAPSDLPAEENVINDQDYSKEKKKIFEESIGKDIHPNIVQVSEVDHKVNEINVDDHDHDHDDDDDDHKAIGEEEQDHQPNFKRRSLSHLFKENEEGNNTTESEKNSSETVTLATEPLENERAKEELRNNVTTKETENSETNKHDQLLAPERATKANLSEEDESAKIIASGEKNEKENPEPKKATDDQEDESAKVKTFGEESEKEIPEGKKEQGSEGK